MPTVMGMLLMLLLLLLHLPTRVFLLLRLTFHDDLRLVRLRERPRPREHGLEVGRAEAKEQLVAGDGQKELVIVVVVPSPKGYLDDHVDQGAGLAHTLEPLQRVMTQLVASEDEAPVYERLLGHDQGKIFSLMQLITPVDTLQ